MKLVLEASTRPFSSEMRLPKNEIPVDSAASAPLSASIAGVAKRRSTFVSLRKNSSPLTIFDEEEEEEVSPHHVILWIRI